MTKLILLNILFLFLAVNIFAQNNKKNDYYNIKQDNSSFIYYTNLYEITEKNNKFENTDIDFSSYYYFKEKIDTVQNNIIWIAKKISVNKFGGFKVDSAKLKIKEQKKEAKKKKVVTIFPQWLIIIFLISLSIIASTNYYYSKYLKELFKSFFNLRAAYKLYDESNILTGRSATALLINFFIITSLAIYLPLEYFYNFKINSFLIFLALFFITIIIYFVKNIFVFLLGKIINISKTASIYNYNIRIYNQVLGLVLAPLLLFITYFNVKYILIFFLICLTTLLLIYLTRVIRSIKIFLHEHFSLLYLFLYLCIVEILPLFILLKLYYMYKI